MKLYELSGIDSDVIDALHKAGIDDIRHLPELANELVDIYEVADLLNLDHEIIQTLLSHAELLSLHGMGPIYTDLMLAAGVHSIGQLSTCDPFVLHDKIREVAQNKKVGRVPNRATVEDWIELAGKYLDSIDK